MVQGYKSTSAVTTNSARDSDAKRTNLQSQRHDKARDVPSKEQTASKYGAWGPIFKNRETFNSMHLC